MMNEDEWMSFFILWGVVVMTGGVKGDGELGGSEYLWVLGGRRGPGWAVDGGGWERKGGEKCSAGCRQADRTAGGGLDR